METILYGINTLLDLFLTDYNEFSNQYVPKLEPRKAPLFDQNQRFPKKSVYFCDFDCTIVFIRALYIDFKMINEKVITSLETNQQDKVDDFIKSRNGLRNKAISTIRFLIDTLKKGGDKALFNQFAFEVYFDIDWKRGSATPMRNLKMKKIHQSINPSIIININPSISIHNQSHCY
ncbi:unnamed protein product [Cunninghamella blakesleeana]